MNEIQKLRIKIDDIDHQIIDLLNLRIEEVQKIALLKKESNTNLFQPERLNHILKERIKYSEGSQLRPELLTKLIQLFHTESLKIQEDTLNKS